MTETSSQGIARRRDREEGVTAQDPSRAERVQVVLADGSRAGKDASEPTRTALKRFGIGTGIVLLVLLVLAGILGQQAAEREGVADARRLTEVLADTVVEPALEDAVVSGDPAAMARLDSLVHERLLGNVGVMRLKLWTPSGEIVYSDERRLMGSTFDLSDAQLLALDGGGAQAAVSGLGREENLFEEGDASLEVYTVVTTPGGQPLLMELYFPYEQVVARRGEILGAFASIAVLGLLAFAALQILLSYVNLRWLRQQREQILRDSARVSDDERRRLAADLHDGIVQELVGASLVVSTAAGTLRKHGATEEADSLGKAGRGIRATVQGLRSMLIDLYPTSLQSAGLHAALDDLVAPLRTGGKAVELVIADDVGLSLGSQAVLHRVAQEACRNVVRHASASHVSMRVTEHERTVRLSVVDDGGGYDVTGVAAAGHLGLRAMADLVERAGGRLVVSSGPGLGTAVELELPL